MKSQSTNRSPGPNGFTPEFYQKCQEELTPILYNIFKTIEMEAIIPDFFLWNQYHLNIDQHPCQCPGQYPGWTVMQMLCQMLAYRPQHYVRQITHPGATYPWHAEIFLTCCKPINLIFYINKIKWRIKPTWLSQQMQRRHLIKFKITSC